MASRISRTTAVGCLVVSVFALVGFGVGQQVSDAPASASDTSEPASPDAAEPRPDPSSSSSTESSSPSETATSTSTGDAQDVMPRVLGMTLDEARAELPEGAGVTVTYLLTRNLAKDQVLKQIPAAGRPVDKSIELVVRRAPTLVSLKPADLGPDWTAGPSSLGGKSVRSAEAEVGSDGVGVTLPDGTQRLEMGMTVVSDGGGNVTVAVLDSEGKTIQRAALREGTARQLRLTLRREGPVTLTADAPAGTSFVLLDPKAWTP